MQAVAFVRSEDESAIFLDRAAKSGAKLILFVGRDCIVEIAARVERIVAQKIVEVSVDGVRARFCDHIDYRSRIPAIFGVKRIREHAKFFDGIRRGLNGRTVYENVVPVSAVDHVIVGATAAAIDGDDAGIFAARKQISA